MFKTLCICILAILAALFGIYVLAEVPRLTGSALAGHDEEEQTESLAKLDSSCSSVSGTVLNVIGQFVAVQEVDSPYTISFVYVKGNLPIGLAPGKTVIMHGELKEGLFNTDNITITGGTPCTAPDTPSQPLGLIGHVIFFIACWLL
jgi:cytochrome c-type biogenesis protein CcmE